jgi:hypothetical protein
MSLSLEQLRSAFKKDTKTEGGGNQNNYFPFHKMQMGESATVRFLPDADKSNPMGFLVEKRSHKLKINGQDRTIPCLTTYGDECPICKVSAAYYKADDKTNGKKYWRKLQYTAQVLVVDSPIAPEAGEQAANGQVKLMTINPQLYKVIKEAFESGDLENIPYQYDVGTNFIIKKDQQGEYASYIMSKFAKRETALDDDTIVFVEAAIKELSTTLPRKPERAEIEAMLEAEMTGSEYKAGAATTAAPAAEEDDADMQAALNRMRAQRAAAMADDEEEEVVVKKTVVAPTPVESDDDDDIIAQLRARRNKA